MKIGDMVKNAFYAGLDRYGIIVEDNIERFIGSLGAKKKYYKVNYLPHPDVPFNGGDMYSEFTCEDFLEVVSSVS